jgi:CRP-like cAMP-binding protein
MKLQKTQNTKHQAVAFDVLQKIPMFRGMSEDEARHLSQIVGVAEFGPAQDVIAQGAQSQRLWVLLEGQCEVWHKLNGQPPKAGPVMLATLEPYSNFGEMSFFHPAPHSASVRAKTPVKLLYIERAAYDRLMTQEPCCCSKLAINTVASLADRLRRMDEWVDELVSKNAASERVPEWNRLRATLFDGWTL